MEPLIPQLCFLSTLKLVALAEYSAQNFNPRHTNKVLAKLLQRMEEKRFSDVDLIERLLNIIAERPVSARNVMCCNSGSLNAEIWFDSIGRAVAGSCDGGCPHCV